MRHRLLSTAVLGAAGLLAACGGGAKAPPLPTVLHAAPEPAVSPPLGRAPAGRVIDLGAAEPEGMVVAPDGTVAIATRRPDALQLLPAATLEPLRRITVPGAARHLELAGASVLVPGEDTDLVSTVALPGGSITAEVKVGRQPHDVVELGSAIVVADELGGAVTDLGTRTGTSVLVKGPIQPGGVAGDSTTSPSATSGRAAVVDVRGRLLYVYAAGDPARLDLIARVPVGDGPTHAVDLGGGLVVVADTSGGRLIVVRITGTPAVVSTVALPGRPYGLAVDPSRHLLYAATGSDNTLHAFTVEGVTLRPGPTWPTVRQPNSVAVAPGTHRILVAGATPDGQLQAIDP